MLIWHLLQYSLLGLQGTACSAELRVHSNMKRGGGPRGPPRKSLLQPTSKKDREHQNGAKSQLEKIKMTEQKLKKFPEKTNGTTKDRDNEQQSRLGGAEMRLANIERMIEDLPDRGDKSQRDG